MGKMKLYVWDPCLTNYDEGLAFAVAESAEAARALIVERMRAGYGMSNDYEPGDDRLPREPTDVYDLTSEVAHFVEGGDG